jgi:hypothetical protein
MAVVAVASWAAVLTLRGSRHSGWCGSELTLPMLLPLFFRASCRRYCGFFSRFCHSAAAVPFLPILFLVLCIELNIESAQHGSLKIYIFENFTAHHTKISTLHSANKI